MALDQKRSKMLGLAHALDKFIQGVGRLASVLAALLVVIIVTQVTARYVFGRGFVVLEELEWHLYAVSFLIGLSFTAVRDSNIRMDILCRKYKPRTKSWLEIFSMTFLVFPFVIVMVVHGYDFFNSAWKLGESSQAPLGLPFRWAIKAFIPISMILLGMAGLVRLIYAIQSLNGGDQNGSD